MDRARAVDRREIARLEAMWRERPDSLLFARIGELYREAGRSEEAVEILRRGLSRVPWYTTARLVLARCLRDLGGVGEADREYRRVVEADPWNLAALRGLGEVAWTREDLREARHWYGRYLEEATWDEEIRLRVRVIDENIGLIGAVGEGGAPKEPGQLVGMGAPVSPGMLTSAEQVEEEAALEPVEAAAGLEPLPAARPVEVAAGPTESGVSPGVGGVPSGSGQADSELVETLTLAGIYERQGYLDRALAIYRRFQERSPGEPRVSEKVRALEERLAASVPTGDEAPMAPTGSPAATVSQVAVPAPARPSRAPSEPPLRVDPNVASAEELVAALKIGREVAERICRARSEGGRFESLEDLQRATGLPRRSVRRWAARLLLPVREERGGGAASASARQEQAERELEEFKAWLRSLRRETGSPPSP